MAILKLYSTGCAKNSRTIPKDLGTPLMTIMPYNSLMDWSFKEILQVTDDTAMAVDFAVIDNKYAYYVLADTKEAKGSWSFTFTMCGIKTYMLAGNTTIEGLWNKTPTWVDSDTVTPAISGYKRGRSINLPGLLPEGWVFVEIRAKMVGHVIGTTEEFADYVTIGGFARSSGRSNSGQNFFLEEIVYYLGNYQYGINQSTPKDEYKDFDVKEIESISYSRLCPYAFSLSAGVPQLEGATHIGFKKVVDSTFKVNKYYSTGVDYSNYTEEAFKYDLLFAPCSNLGMPSDFSVNGKTDKVLIKGLNNLFFYVETLGGWEYFVLGPKPSDKVGKAAIMVTKFTSDPRELAPTKAFRWMYVYNNTTIEFGQKDKIRSIGPISGEFNLNLTDEEKKFGVATVFAPSVMGTIDRAQNKVNYYYEVDNTGWYLNLELPMGKIVIPAFKLPYASDAWKEYQFREMEYDRAELARANEYAKDKFWADVAKGIGNGAVAGGFAGTHSPQFGGVMGGLSIAGTVLGAYADRQVEVSNAQRQQDNKENMMKSAVDNYYNSGYGYRLATSNDFMVNIAMPIDDMEKEVEMSGYSCTGTLVATLDKGFIQGTPKPSAEIKGTIRNLIVSELQMGTWII